MINLKQYLIYQQQLINKAIVNYLPDCNSVPSLLYDAMSYSINSGGKRIRPILTLATGEMLGAKKNDLLPVACAVEFIHTYSLIHDDLPAMDNDDFRRGKPTVHKKFGEPIAILAGDALLTRAFEVIATKVKNAKLSQRLISEITYAVGAEGMVGGQVLDLHFARKLQLIKNKRLGSSKSWGLYNKMLIMKTAKLIRSAVLCGAIVARANNNVLSNLGTYGGHLGLAFQLKDDALDSPHQPFGMGSEPTLRANLQKDRHLVRARFLVDCAKKVITPFGQKAEILHLIADYVINRTY
jgi:geranylgeranyl diphosphate synthase type II